jgi:peptidyl-prolyl cis-trans isomerase SurA
MTGKSMRFKQVTRSRLRSVAALVTGFTVSFAGMLAHASADPSSISNGQTARAAAVVNDIVISSYDLDQRVKLAMVTSGQQPSPDLARRLHDQILRQLVDEMLQMLEAQKYNVKVQASDVEGALKRIGQQNNITPEQINKMLDDNGIARATLQQQLQADLAWQKLVQQRIAPRVSVSDEEVDDVLRRMQESASSTQYLAAEIFIPVESPQQEAQAKQSIENIRGQLQQGASFASMARQFSKSSSASGGGDLGWITDSDVAPELAKVLQSMHPGNVSEPIRAAGGFYLIGMREKRTAAGSKPEAAPAPTPTPAAAAVEQPKPMQAHLTLSTIQIALPANADKAKQDKVRNSAIKLYQTVNGCGNLAALAKAEGATTVPLGLINVKDLAPDFRKILEKTPNGRATPPLRSANGVQMFVVCAGGMSPGRQAMQQEAQGETKPFQMPTREEIQNRLYNQELSMMSRRYLRDLRRDASIDIRDN